MYKKLSILHFIFYIFLFIGCATKTIPVYSIINTPYIKVSDQGFLKKGFNYKKLVIYKDANIPVEISIYKNSICLNKRCYPKDKFVKKLSPDYPKNLLDNIIEKKPIENLGKITKIKKGFLQKNKRFFYQIDDKKVLFKDKLKKIIIMIKELN
ncbi:conserved hypothetical protein [Lebetimonas natsushimae]|uniref:Lipoprotein n=1 Tax=Lebetimonas natsushimae TaxID=1936991 RepID=A0A292YBG1_9BACT|nr:hypothetical protein [Lebetimonas natsushimae]GAX86863.1 conserved hypothetical protein [Lebetimonas natsushimae]